MRFRRFRAQQWKQHHFANRVRIRQQHHQAVDADALAGRRRQTVRQRANIIHIHFFRRFLPALFHLCAKTPLLIERIVQLRKAVGQFHPGHKELEALRQRRIIRLLLRKRRNRRRKIVYKCRLHQMRFGNRFKKLAGQFAIRKLRHIRHGIGAVRPRVNIVALRHALAARRPRPIPRQLAPRLPRAGQYFTIASRIESRSNRAKSIVCSPYLICVLPRHFLRQPAK